MKVTQLVKKFPDARFEVFIAVKIQVESSGLWHRVVLWQDTCLYASQRFFTVFTYRCTLLWVILVQYTHSTSISGYLLRFPSLCELLNSPVYATCLTHIIYPPLLENMIYKFKANAYTNIRVP